MITILSSGYNFTHAKLQKIFNVDILINTLPFGLFWHKGDINHYDEYEERGLKLGTINYNDYSQKYVFQATTSVSVDGKEVDKESSLNNLSRIIFNDINDDKHGRNYLTFVLPINRLLRHPEEDITFKKSIFIPKRKVMGPRRPMAERQIVQRWSFDEREHIKKYLLLYGYGRWKKIITASKDADISISHRKLEEIRAYSNAFVRSICDNLTFDKYELKLFQLNIIKEGPDDPYVPVNSKDWDLNLIRQRANPWGKRLQLLYRVYLFVDEFKKYYSNKYGKKPSNVFHFKNLLNFLSGQMLLGQRPSVWWTRNHDIDQIVGTCRFGYANYQTMKNCEEFGFNELEKTCSYQEFPNADTITRRLKKLIQLIVRHEQSTAKFDFDALDNDDNELEEFSKEEKRDFFNCLFDYGVPISDDGKYNWHGLREKFYSANAGYTPKSISSIEKLVQHFRIVCQQIIQENRALENQEDLNDPKTDQEIEKNDMTDQENLEYQNDENQYNTNWKNQQTNGADQVQNGLIPVSGNGTNHVGKNSKGSQERRSGLDNYDDGERMDEEDLQDDKSDSQNMVDNMKDQIIDEMTEGNCDLNKLPQKNDSDRKDINITLEEAKRFHMNTNMLHFIRRYILFSQRALFKNSIEDFTKFASELDESHPAYISDVNYLPSTQDLGLLMCSAENGLDSLKSIKTGMYGFEMIHLSNEKIFGRLDFLCEFFKNQHNRTNLKKRKVDKNFRDESKKKLKNVIQVDDNGEIIFPIVISTSLKLQSLGVIKPGPFYHSEHNLFPVGYKSLRVYASIFNKGEKAEYTCEIIDGGDKPLYRVTSSEDPDHPIVRESSTGCWVHICKKVNDLADQKKQKVTISGTERFGLLEPNIVKLLESLSDADKCEKYIFKSRNTD